MLSRIAGPVLGPFESYLTMRGIKTLALRFRAPVPECQGAGRMARRITRASSAFITAPTRIIRTRPLSSDCFAPGLFGAILSFEIKDANKASVLAFMDRLQMIVPGTSLGDVHTLLLYPLIASHRNVSPKMRERMGIRENLVRVAAGIEDVDDIKADLDQALRSAAALSHD